MLFDLLKGYVRARDYQGTCLYNLLVGTILILRNRMYAARYYLKKLNSEWLTVRLGELLYILICRSTSGSQNLAVLHKKRQDNSHFFAANKNKNKAADELLELPC